MTQYHIAWSTDDSEYEWPYPAADEIVNNNTHVTTPSNRSVIIGQVFGHTYVSAENEDEAVAKFFEACDLDLHVTIDHIEKA